MRSTDLRNVRILVIGQAVTAAIAVVALVIAVIAFNAKAEAIQTSRRDGRLDSCYLLRSLVLEAAAPSHRAAVRSFLARSELNNCTTYARHLSGG